MSVSQQVPDKSLWLIKLRSLHYTKPIALHDLESGSSNSVSDRLSVKALQSTHANFDQVWTPQRGIDYRGNGANIDNCQLERA